MVLWAARRGTTSGTGMAGEFPENYDYGLDVEFSIRADKDVRAGMRAAGLKFVPDRDAAWYGFPDNRPPKEHRA
ncbi:MAG: hypothetical protein LW698_14705 [Planctomycetaceae bacterium]|nr:hypothetical protein [Planctomycetaceae bacterium]